MQWTYQNLLMEWQRLRQHKPRWFYLAAFGACALIYYLLILLPLNLWADSLQDDIQIEKNNVSWMSKASQEILRLRSTTPQTTVQKINETPFTYLNRSITEQGWNTLVTDVHQIDQNRIQINFNEIAFTELMNWLKTILTAQGIYVVDAAMTRVKPGVVQANLTLQTK